MSRTRKRIIWMCASALLLLCVLFAAFQYYYPIYRNRAVHALKATVTRDALTKMISNKGLDSAASLRNYRNAGLNRGLSLLSSPSPPNLDPPVLLYATLLLPNASKEGIIYLFWLEYGFEADGMVLEYVDGSSETCPIFPVWDKAEHDWFKALAHRDFAVKVFNGPQEIRSTLPKSPIICEPLERLLTLRRIRLHLFDGRISAPVELFVIPEELRAGTDIHVATVPAQK